MTSTRSVDNFTSVNDYNDVVDILVAENAINNIPNGTSNGQVPLWYSGGYTLTGNTSIRIGQNAGFTNFKDHSIALGTNAGRHENGTASIAIGFNAGRTHSGTNSISIGYLAGNMTQGASSVAIGDGSGKNSQGDWAVSIGIAAGSTGQKNNSISIGPACGNFNQGTNSIAIGLYSGFTAQGENCIAIGNQAGTTNQPNNSICLNATGIAYTPNTQSAFFVDPIRNSTNGSNVMCYDTANKEISYASNISLSNPLTITQGSATLPAINFQGDTNCGIYSSGADTINFSTAGVNRMNISSSGYLTLSGGQLVIPNGSVSTPSLSWSGNSINTGIYLPSQDVLGISCDGNLRCSFGTSAITMATSLYLPTSGGTSSALEYYEELTHSSSWTYTGATIPSFNFLLRRIGKMVSIQLTTMGVAYKNTGGASKLTLTTALPTRFRPSESIYMPISIEVNANTSHRTIVITSAGVIEIGDVNTSAFAINTDLRVLACSYTFTLS